MKCDELKWHSFVLVFNLLCDVYCSGQRTFELSCAKMRCAGVADNAGGRLDTMTAQAFVFRPTEFVHCCNDQVSL